MNKTTAKRAAAAGKPPRVPQAAKAAKAASAKRLSAKPASKASTGKPVARPAAKAAAKPAPRTAPAKKSAPAKAPVARPSAKPAAKAPNKIAPPVVTRTPAPKAPAAKAAAAPKATPRATSASASKNASHGVAMAAAPTPAQVSASRFADRFAPARPPARASLAPAIEAPRGHAKADPKLANAWKTKNGRDLTDGELVAMPDAEYMNDKQLDFFRARLQALKDDLLSNAGETTEHLREDTSIVPDPADRATIEEEHALELRTRDRERKLLKKISQSLARIDAGDYGFCDETGEPIGLARLIARPTATLSLEAQQRRELKQKMFGD